MDCDYSGAIPCTARAFNASANAQETAPAATDTGPHTLISILIIASDGSTRLSRHPLLLIFYRR